MVPDVEVLLGPRHAYLLKQSGLQPGWFRGLPKAYALALGLQMVSFLVNNQLAQISECLAATKILSLELRGPETHGIFIFPDESTDVFVDLKQLHCTCRTFNALVEPKGMCRHLMVALTRFGLSILLNPVEVLRSHGHADLLKPYPRAHIQFAQDLPDVAKPGVLAMVTAFVITGRNPLMVQQVLAALDYPVPTKLRILDDGGYGFRGRHQHNMDLGNLTCSCPDHEAAGFCEGLLVMILSAFLSDMRNEPAWS